MYSYFKDNGTNNKTAKSIKKIVIKKDIKHEDYKKLYSINSKYTIKTIRSDHHQLASYELNKISRSRFDDKRYIHNNGVTSYAYGHCQIPI